MRNIRKYTNNSDTDDYIFDDDIETIDLFDESGKAVSHDNDEKLNEEDYEYGREENQAAADEHSDLEEYGNEPKSKGKKRHTVIAVCSVASAVILIIAGIIIERFVPSRKYVDNNEYYDLENADGARLIYDYKLTDYEVIVQDGRYYIDNDFFKENITDKFYFDKGNESVIYTTPTQIYTTKIGTSEYDIDGVEMTLDYVPAILSEERIFIAVDYAADKAGFSYEIYSEPDRIAIMTDGTEYNVVELGQKAVVRDKASVKGSIFEKASDNTDTVWAASGEDSDGWIGVMAADGRKGYVKEKDAQVISSRLVYNSGYVPEEYTNQLKDYQIVLAWHAVYDTGDNNEISALLENTRGITTVSPTWYKVIDEEGTISSLADWEYISTVHDAGMEIWPLISDFTSTDQEGGWDEAELFANTDSRRRLIKNIITEITTYGFDGINIDFEKVPQESGDDYKQFIRELSIECRKAGVVLSIDNYVPRTYNSQYNRAAQAECADYVIVMGYDEHYAGGEEAGSVSSIEFVTDGIDGTLEEVPKEKLINALPFYTRLWMEGQDEDGNYTLNSKSYSMQGGLDIADELELDIEWDDEVKQYVATGIVDGVSYSIWLEEEKSLEAKMAVVRNRELAGVACWSLGMELDSVWDIITE